MSSDLTQSQSKRKRRWWLRITLALLGLLLASAVGFYVWQRGSLPETSGTRTLAGLEDEVRLSRSPDGLTYIEAGNEHDALFALGFAHAQDRLFQMDLMRRLAAGRLSEVVGSQTIRTDKFFRTLGLYEMAEANLAGLSPEVQAALEAYSAGVNAYLETRSGPLPIGFALTGHVMEPWKPVDSVAWGRLMALFLSGNYREELMHARLLSLLPAEKVKQLYPNWPDWAPTAVPALAEMEKQGLLKEIQDILPWEIGPKLASNAWALAPKRSSTGGALLAGDPHLALTAPGDWYLVRIDTPDLTLAGATTPGVPLLVMGHNGTLAWSFTTTYSDTQDLFIEEVDPDNSRRYRTKEGWRDFETRMETIKVAGEEPVTFTVRKTYHGPVISDVVEQAQGLYPDHQVLALSWTALQTDDRSPEGLYRLNRASDVHRAIAALRDLDSPQQTMILADSRGSIALVAPGRVPVRRAGNGLVPVPGAEGAYDWIGEIPYDALPRSIDPESGVLLTANNRLVGDDYRYLIAAQWSYPDRAARIAEMLKAKPVWSPEDLQQMQLDVLSFGARRLMGRLLKADFPADADPVMTLMRNWDFRMEADRPEPLVYSAWLRALERQLIADELGEVFPQLADGDSWRVYSLLGPDSLWCDDVSTQAVETCDQQIAAALDRALKELVKEFGDDPDKWRWGKAHFASFDHPVLRFVPIVNSLTAIEIATPGGQDTVNRAGSDYSLPLKRAFQDRHGPGFRGVYDMADPDASGFIIATGNSGNIFSPFYGNLVERWRNGDLLPLTNTPPSGSETLLLTP